MGSEICNPQDPMARLVPAHSLFSYPPGSKLEVSKNVRAGVLQAQTVNKNHSVHFCVSLCRNYHPLVLTTSPTENFL